MFIVNFDLVNYIVNEYGNWVVIIDYKFVDNIGMLDFVIGIEWNYCDCLFEI